MHPVSAMEQMDMRPIIWLPVAIFVAGVACIIAAVAEGEAEVSLVLIFPVFSGSSGLFLLGTVLIVLSFFVGFAMQAMGQIEMGKAQRDFDQAISQQAPESKSKYGGVVLIGPVPIAFGSDKAMAVLMLVVGIVLAIIVLGLVLALA